MENLNGDFNKNRREIRPGIYYNLDARRYENDLGDEIPARDLVKLGLLNKVGYRVETGPEDGDEYENNSTLTQLLFELNMLLIQLENKQISIKEAKEILMELKSKIEKFKEDKNIKTLLIEIRKYILNDKEPRVN